MTTNHALDSLFALVDRARQGRDAERELEAVAKIYAERNKPKTEPPSRGFQEPAIGPSIEEPFHRVVNRHPVKAAVIEFDGIPPFRDPSLVGAPLERHTRMPEVTARSLVREILQKTGRAMTTREIKEATGVKIGSIYSACSHMRVNREIERVKYGVYRWPAK
ncbi:MAG: hypothetical protein JWR83_2858 [Aeromicrobium sp.]|nr:hypothetical protein [Aeromicrobium sp.]